jgi:3,4-dihydroxy 2-butanone 4-phosphate synthase/GTP cyclohydrolase II
MFVSVEQAIADLQNGKPIILIDDHKRENEGDLIFPAETITPEIMNVMIRQGTGIVCLAMAPEMVDQLALPLMVNDNSSRNRTAFTVSIEAKTGISTGVSAADRVQTVLAAVKDGAKPEDLARPGHIFPLRAVPYGVLQRPGHTEGSTDLARMAGYKPAAVICEVMNPDGSMAKGDELMQFAKQHQYSILGIDDVIAYRQRHEKLIEAEASANLNLDPYGKFTIQVFKEKVSGVEHVALISQAKTEPVVRVHSCCLTGDVFGSLRCDCRKQLDYALEQIASRGGVLIYLNQEGRGIGLANKIKAYALQEQGLDTVEANIKLGLPEDSRQYWVAAQILQQLNVSRCKLLTNNPKKLFALTAAGIAAERELTPTFVNDHNRNYLLTKLHKLGHLLKDIL